MFSAHHAPHDIQQLIIKEEFWSEAWWLEGHKEEVAMRTAVRFVSVGLEMSQETWPKRISTSIDQGQPKVFFEYAIALISDLADLVLNPYQLAVPRGSPVWQTSPSQTTTPTGAPKMTWRFVRFGGVPGVRGDQFGVGSSTWSMISDSTGPVWDCSFSPS